MAIYAIGDLHLGFAVNKPMSIFGEQWNQHEDKIKASWLDTVTEDDLVLIPGDISWGMNMDEALKDLKWIDELPGKKVFIRGNHDYWWKSISKLNQLSDSMVFIQNGCFAWNEFTICGSRGWLCPNPHAFTEQDEKIYNHELRRLEMSLEAAKSQGASRIIAMIHYPPTNEAIDPSGFTQLMTDYKVEKVIYGHLHGQQSFEISLKGPFHGTNYQLVSADYLDFKIARIKD